MKPALLRAVTLALCLVAFASLVNARCISRAEVRAAIARQMPDARTMLLADEEVQAFLAAYNATPLVTAHTADEILLIELASEPMIARAVLFKHGCFSDAGLMPRLLVKSLLSTLERRKS